MKIPCTDSYNIPKNSSYFTELLLVATSSLILLTATVTTETTRYQPTFFQLRCYLSFSLSLSLSLIPIIIVVFKYGSPRFLPARSNNRLAIASNVQAIITGHQGRFCPWIGVYSGYIVDSPPCALPSINRHIRKPGVQGIYDGRRSGTVCVSIGSTCESGAHAVVLCMQPCRCSLAKLERFTAARPLQFSSIRSDHRPWSRARFLSGIVQPISTGHQGTCCHPPRPFPLLSYLLFAYIYP